MQFRCLAALAVLTFWSTATALAAPPPAEVMKPIMAVGVAVNSGNGAGLAGLYTSDAVVGDEFAPFAWTGAGAGQAWLGTLEKFLGSLKMSGFKAVAQEPTEYQTDGMNAYVVLPLVLTGMTSKPFHETGFLTFTLRKAYADWKITSQVWTTSSSSM